MGKEELPYTKIDLSKWVIHEKITRKNNKNMKNTSNLQIVFISGQIRDNICLILHFIFKFFILF